VKIEFIREMCGAFYMAKEACENVWEKRQQHNELAIVG